jgi:hypothetical protein
MSALANFSYVAFQHNGVFYVMKPSMEFGRRRRTRGQPERMNAKVIVKATSQALSNVEELVSMGFDVDSEVCLPRSALVQALTHSFLSIPCVPLSVEGN